jgi:hypothetical protein
MKATVLVAAALMSLSVHAGNMSTSNPNFSSYKSNYAKQLQLIKARQLKLRKLQLQRLQQTQSAATFGGPSNQFAQPTVVMNPPPTSPFGNSSGSPALISAGEDDGESASGDLDQRRNDVLEAAFNGLTDDARSKVDDCTYYSPMNPPDGLPDITSLRCLQKVILKDKAHLHKGDHLESGYLNTERVDMGYKPNEDKVQKCMTDNQVSRDICILAEYESAIEAHDKRLDDQMEGSEAAGTGSSY